MFEKWKKTKQAVYEVESENLAVPEVHIKENCIHDDCTKDKREEEDITYENVAIPEIHIKRKKQD